MKQPKQISPVKSARKTAKQDIQQRIISTVKAIAIKFGQDEGKLTKKFRKKSKKLAKKIVEELEIAKTAAAEKPKKSKALSSEVKPKVTSVETTAKKEKDSKVVKKSDPVNVAEKKNQPAKPKVTQTK